MLLVGTVGAVLLGSLERAEAASYVQRSLLVRDGQFELGLGVGIGHRDAIDETGLGLNLELGYGMSSTLELRFRTGVRFSRSGKVTEADYYARAHQSETNRYDGFDTLANPEIGLRFRLTRSGSVELAFDARAYLPLDDYFGLLGGLPLALKLGGRVRLDTGLFVPIVFADGNTIVDFSIPAHLWILLNSGTYLGPMTGMYFYDGGGRAVPFGFGLGTSLSYDADVRFWVYFPDVSGDGGADNFGLGVGLYVTF